MNISVFRILLALRDSDAAAGDILERIETLDPDGKKPPLATFYRDLKRASDAGLLEVLEESDPAGGPGRPRQEYRITSAGREAALAEGERLQALAAIALSDGGAGKG